MIKFGKRDSELIKLLATEGLSNKELAYRLKLKEGTIKTYLSGIYKRLEINTRVQLVVWYLENHNENQIDKTGYDGEYERGCTS